VSIDKIGSSNDAGRILLVEDSEDQRDAMLSLLVARSYRADGVATVADALRLLHAHTYDAVVSDYNLPDGSVDSLAAHVSSAELIVITGSLLVVDGGLPFPVFTKPLNIPRFFDCLRKTLSRA
jgi:DNA-binding NtrC family response regulator